ncbi:death-associated protein kinase dapk-1-like [Anneissia japonica]|uniref:death-associated protein kinase dapk-1-like n=1 Tax=Anneissia japonica TaxID=1529436 RepID=UPI001425BB07|nr:death-associated protein kinase dapk-1-like [Anneissia japonica]
MMFPRKPNKPSPMFSIRKSTINEQRLIRAVSDNDSEEVRRLTKDKRVEINTLTELGQTSLHLAAANGYIEICEILVKGGADLKGKDKEGRNPLHEASKENQLDVCKFIVNRSKSTLNEKDNGGLTPLGLAILLGHQPICEFLLCSGADTATKDNYGRAPLHLAVIVNKIDICCLLVDNNAQIKEKNKEGKTSIDIAEELNHRTVADYLKSEANLQDLLKLAEGGQPLDVLKLNIIGHPMSGKTTLLKSLSKKRWNPLRLLEKQKIPLAIDHKATPGVRIISASIPNVGKFSARDFAGQSEYHITHSAFFGIRNAIFLLLYNITIDQREQKSQLKHWLAMIKACQRESVISTFHPDEFNSGIVIVATHMDLVDDSKKREATNLAKQNVEEMQQIFRTLNITSDCVVLQTHKSWDEQIKPLRESLEKLGKRIRGTKRIPVICQRITNHLQDWVEELAMAPLMSFTAFEERVNSITNAFVTKELLKTAARFMTDTGEIYFAEFDSDEVEDQVVINPGWLTSDLFGRLFASSCHTLFDGVQRVPKKELFTYKEISEIVGQIASPKLAIQLLKHLNLIHEHREDTYIIPSLLPMDLPVVQWSADDQSVYFGRHIRCVDESDMFTPGFFPYLQVNILKRLEDFVAHSKLTRNTIKSAVGYVESIVKMSSDQMSLFVAVKVDDVRHKEECNTVLSQLMNDVDDVKHHVSQGTHTEMRVVSVVDMKKESDVTECHSYALEDVIAADDGNGFVVNTKRGKNEHVTEIICAGYDITILKVKGYASDIKWLKSTVVQKLQVCLERVAEMQDYRTFAEKIKIMDAIEIEHLHEVNLPGNEGKLSMLLRKWSEHQERCSTISNLCAILKDMERHDALNIVHKSLREEGFSPV